MAPRGGRRAERRARRHAARLPGHARAPNPNPNPNPNRNPDRNRNPNPNPNPNPNQVTLALIGLLYFLLNLLLACSLLNHYSFAHEAVAASPFGSALVLLLSCVDASCLTLLASDCDEARLKAATS